MSQTMRLAAQYVMDGYTEESAAERFGVPVHDLTRYIVEQVEAAERDGLLSEAAKIYDGWSVDDPLTVDYHEAHDDSTVLLDQDAPDRAIRNDVSADISATEEPPRYGDVAALLADGIPDPPQPDILFRSDGYALFYRGKVNTLFGDSESGKTWIALAAMVEVLIAGGKAAVLDLDHNGMAETVTRALQLGAKPADLADPDRFRYCEPEDAHELIWFVRDIAAWAPDLAIVDSLGEVLPMLGLNSNSPDEYTTANRTVATPLARSGAAVVTVDHLPKDDSAREKGQTGTMAKKRANNGVSLRVTVQEQFTPGFGGAANLTINKDRPGGLRGHCPPGKNAPAGRFVMVDNGDGMTWHITTPPSVAPKGTGPRVSDEDIAAVLGLPVDQRTKRKVQDHFHWGSERANKAVAKCRELGECADDN